VVTEAARYVVGDVDLLGGTTDGPKRDALVDAPQRPGCADI
jgi:hypothetical protein